jgi:hypothetical protein
MTKQEKVVSLKAHLAKVSVLLTTVPTRRLGYKEEYLKWVNLEITRTNKKIQELESA